MGTTFQSFKILQWTTTIMKRNQAKSVPTLHLSTSPDSILDTHLPQKECDRATTNQDWIRKQFQNFNEPIPVCSKVPEVEYLQHYQGDQNIPSKTVPKTIFPLSNEGAGPGPGQCMCATELSEDHPPRLIR
jgi:hypothetical protein